MNESLSIDEIIRQAEEIRKKTVKQAQSALEDVNTSANEITKREIEVPKPDIENIKIQPKSENVKTYEKSTASDKTKVGPAIKLKMTGKQSILILSRSQRAMILQAKKPYKKAFLQATVPKNRFIPKSRRKLLKGLPR